MRRKYLIFKIIRTITFCCFLRLCEDWWCKRRSYW